jgi:uncharacterized membrane protein
MSEDTAVRESDTALRQAKRPSTVVAGPYGHPFHALLVTIPIGAWVASFVFDIVSVSGDADAFGRGALWLIGIGLVGAVLAAVVGLMDLSGLARGTRVRKIALTHMAINLTVVALFIVSFAIRVASGYDPVNVPGIVVSVVALLLLGVSGFLGGELAYRYGVRVADEETQRAGFDS